VIEMRPKFGWRVAMLVAGCGSAASFASDRSLRSGFLVAAAVVGVLASFRSRVLLRDGVIHRRGPFRRYRPLPLIDVTELSLHWDTTLAEPPFRELKLRSDTQLQEFSLRWWHDCRRFLGGIASALSDVDADGGRRWLIAVDAKTQRRIESALNTRR